MFNVMALKSLDGDAAFAAIAAPIVKGMTAGETLRSLQYPWLDGLRGRALFDAWRATAETTADVFAATDPKARLKWFGPDMSALSSIMARKMETWAHGQEVFDALGQTRVEQDRARNIAHLAIAQCFAGPPESPPAPGARHIAG